MRRDGSAYVVQVEAGREMLAKNLGKRKKENFFDYYKYMYIYKKIPLSVIGEALPCKSNFFARILRVYI